MTRRRHPIPSVVSHESIQYLKHIYTDELAQNFIVDLMNIYATQKLKQYTKQEQALAPSLQKIELANALEERRRREETIANADTVTTSPQLHLIQSKTVGDNYNSLTQPGKPDIENSIFRMTIEFGDLYDAAHDIMFDCYQESQKRNPKISSLSDAIYKLIQESYNSKALAQHISHLSNQANTTNAAIKSVKKTLGGKLDILNETVVDLTSKVDEEREAKATLNQTIAKLNVTVIDLNQSIILNTSTASTMGGVPNGLMANNRYVPKVRDPMDPSRWSCVTIICRHLSTTIHPRNSLYQPLSELLQQLLTISNQGPDQEDNTVKQWLEKNKVSDRNLQEDLVTYKMLPPNQIPSDKIEEYYHSLAYLFNKGQVFPKNRQLTEHFNNLRPLKRPTVSAKEEESSTAAPEHS